MELLSKTLREIWRIKIKNRFELGFITYERQLQAEIYHQLKNCLPKNYEIWVEPVIYLSKEDLDKVKPDLFITKDSNIIAIIELKFKPWEYPRYRSDIEKLNRFKKASLSGKKLIFGYKPISPDWNYQYNASKLDYILKKDHLSVFITFGKPHSDAFTLKDIHIPSNFLHLIGYIENNGNIVFE